MRVLLDEQLPLDLSLELHGHAVDTVVSRGWAGIKKMASSWAAWGANMMSS